MEPKTPKAVLREQTITRKGCTKFANLKEVIPYGLYLTSSRAASPANHSPKLDEEKEREMTASSGPRCLGLFASLDPDGSSVRMLRDCLLSSRAWYSNKCALTWKEKGTPFKRLLYQLSPSTRRTDGIGSGLLPTSTNRDYKGKREGARRGFGGDINDAIAMLPTPTTQEVEHPQAILSKTGRRKAPNGNTHSTGLADQIRMLPTPDTSDRRSQKSKQWGVSNHIVGTKTGLKLQPAFALWMMGYPTDWLDLEDGEMPLSKAQATRLSRKSPQK